MSFLLSLLCTVWPLFCMFMVSLPLCQCSFSFFFWLTLTDIVVLSFFLSFLYLFFLPVAWAVDLAVQGCKYHCRLLHSRPSIFPHQSSYISCIHLSWCASSDDAHPRVTGASAAWKISLHFALSLFFRAYFMLELCA